MKFTITGKDYSGNFNGENNFKKAEATKERIHENK